MTHRFNGMDVRVVDAQNQRRTPRDVRGPWVRPKVPSKIAGRKGTRREFKRRNAPNFVMMYREPTDVIVIGNQTIIATPAQWNELCRASQQHAWDARPGSVFGTRF